MHVISNVNIAVMANFMTITIIGRINGNIMIKGPCLTSVFFIFPFFVSAQTVINGSVKNLNGKPVAASMTVQSAENNAIAGFSTSDKDGNYNLKYKGTADSIVITASGINIGKHQKTVVNRSGRVDFVIDEKPLELKEIQISPAKIKRTGDTLDYSVAAYIDRNDRVIGDVIRKMPGIEVSKSGGISYNGKAINKFYVENMDLLQGRYGLAVNNISAKDVVTVQIMENHQPVKALRDRIIPDQAALNLKLKESAKGTVSLNGMAGLGYEPLMWNAELVAMYFAKKRQNISMYKGNNSGSDVTGEFRAHYDYERVLLGYGSQLYVQSPSTPPVSQNRYIYNSVNAFTVNQLIKVKEDWECTVNAQYYNDRITKEGHSIYEQYFAGDSTLRIEETVSSVNNISNAEIALRLNANEKDYYFNDALNFRANWNNDSGLGNTKSAGIDKTVSQHLDRPSFSVDNTLNVLRNIKKNDSYNIHFSAGYAVTPHTLTVTPLLYSIGETNLSSLTQDVLSKEFASLLRTSYRIGYGYFDFDYSAWIRADVKKLNTELSGENGDIPVSFADSMKNDLFYGNYQTGLNQSYSYKNYTVGLRANISLPVTYLATSTDNRIPDRFTKYNKLLFNPSASISYDLTPELTLSTGASYNKSFGDMSSRYTGYIMHGYRTLFRNNDERPFESHSEGGNASLGYRNVFRTLFINAGINYRHLWKNILYGYSYQGIMNVKTNIDRPTESENYGINFNASKGFRFWNTTLRISGGYGEVNGEQLIQDEILNYRSENYSAGTSINMNPFSLFGLNYSINWSRNKTYTVERPERFPAIRGISQNARFSVFVTELITLNLSAEHQYSSAIHDGNRNTGFADAGIKFKNKKLDLELELNNIFNSKKYISASYSDISTYYYSYNLRPASVLLKVRFKLK
jgi:hypothetical protein